MCAKTYEVTTGPILYNILVKYFTADHIYNGGLGHNNDAHSRRKIHGMNETSFVIQANIENSITSTTMAR